MNAGLALGIDFGTSAVKGVLISRGGDVAASAAAGYPTQRPRADIAEQSPADWLTALREVTRAIATQADTARIEAIGLSGQLNGILRCAADGTPHGPALTWLDQRAENETEALERDFGDRLYEITGNRANAIAVAPKLRWLARNEGLKAELVLQVKDWIAFRLTGTARTERNEASGTLLMDFARGAWDPALCDWAGIGREQLPPIGNATDIAGVLRPQEADELGLPHGIPVVQGSGDTGALALGCGAFAPGTVAVTLGTAGHVVAASPLPPQRQVRGMWRMGHVTPDRELWLGLIPAGALSVEWLRDIFAMGGARPDFAALDRVAAAVDPLSVEALFLPFLAGAGTPWNAPARAVLSGLDMSQGPGHLIRAVQAGVAHAIAASLAAFADAGLSAGGIRLAEGGARSPLWCQTIADVTGRDVELLAHDDTSAIGAALLGFAGISKTPPAAALEGLTSRAVRPVHIHRPDPARHRFYLERHARFMTRAAQETGR